MTVETASMLVAVLRIVSVPLILWSNAVLCLGVGSHTVAAVALFRFAVTTKQNKSNVEK